MNVNAANEVNVAEAEVSGLNVANQERRTRKKRKSIKGRSRETRAHRKKNRNLGRTYVTEKGKVVRGRECKLLGNCRMKCSERFSDNDRKKIFDEYWEMGSQSKRSSYIGSLVTTTAKRTETKRKESQKPKNRLVTHCYHIKINGEMKVICKQCFLDTFNETNRFVSYALEKSLSSVGSIPVEDKRGKHSPRNKTTDADVEKVRSHILSIPAYESHYTRRHTSRKYIPSHYTLAKMYDEYKVFCAGSKVVSRTVYEKIFHDMNLSIKKPKTDTCHTCDKMQMQIVISSDDAKHAMEEMLANHQLLADEAYSSKATDKESALLDDSSTVLTFDMQQCLPTPFVESSVAFYKRQLWTFNLTVHDCKDGQATCYMWSEVDGGRGANQVASCLAKHLNNLPPHVKNVVMYSDTCSGQNKNSHLAAMCLTVLKNHKTLETLDHKFLVPGHTHMECDVDHAMIERNKKKSGFPIYHPHDWMQLVRLTGKKNPLQVVPMYYTDFMQYSDLLKDALNMKKINDIGEAFVWKNVKWLRFTKEYGVIFYKEGLDRTSEFKKMTVWRRGRARDRLIPKPSYSGKQQITLQKKKDLLDLLPLIPPTFHDFYKGLPTSSDSSADIHPDTIEDEENEENV